MFWEIRIIEPNQVHPSDVFGPSIPGPIVFIVDCPTESHARVLLSSESLNGYYSNLSGNPPLSTKVVNCIIHLTPASVVSSPSYEKWIQKLYSAQHVMAGHAMILFQSFLKAICWKSPEDMGRRVLTMLWEIWHVFGSLISKLIIMPG